MIHEIREVFKRRTRRLAWRLAVDARLIGLLWLATAVSALILRNLQELAHASAFNLLLLMLAATVPALAMQLTLNALGSNRPFAQPVVRLARLGRWRDLDCLESRSHVDFGPGGFLATLFLGLLINIPVRFGEYLLAIPLPPVTAPVWLQTLYFLTTVDLIILSSCYAIAFGLAVKGVPLFPRFLCLIWGLDILAQLVIARVMDQVEGVPAAVTHSLQALLDGNLQKIGISVALWFPYLLFSRRVNLTYRQRVPA